MATVNKKFTVVMTDKKDTVNSLLKRPKYKNFHCHGNKKSNNYERRNRR